MKIRIDNVNAEIIRYNDFEYEGTIVTVDSVEIILGLKKYRLTEENGNLIIKPEYPEKVMIECNKSNSYIEPISSIKFGIKKGQ